MIRVVLPAHLRTLARVEGEVKLDVQGQVTQRSVLDALEAQYPMLCGTLRDHVTQQRRPFVRFFACEEDLSHEPPDAPLPDAVVKGDEPFLVVGAIAGGAAPIVAAWLFSIYKTGTSIAIYIFICAVIGFLATLLMTEYSHKDISEEYKSVGRS